MTHCQLPGSSKAHIPRSYEWLTESEAQGYEPGIIVFNKLAAVSDPAWLTFSFGYLRGRREFVVVQINIKAMIVSMEMDSGHHLR